jgi:adenosine/AMP kinase
MYGFSGCGRDQTHFSKAVEAGPRGAGQPGAGPGIRFGRAFGEASGECLVRWSGTDPDLTGLARKNTGAWPPATP